MFYKALTIGITLFWLAMMACLAQREIVPAFQAAHAASQPTDYRYLERLASTPRVSRMGIFLRDKRIGYSLSRMRMVHETLHLESKTEIKLSLSPGGLPAFGPNMGSLDVLLQFHARIMQGELVGMRLTVSSPPNAPPFVTIDGIPVGEMLHLKIRHGDQIDMESIPFNSSQLISSGLAQTFALPKLAVGESWQFRTLDPFSRSVRTSEARVTGRETVTINGENIEAYLIVIPHRTAETKIWASGDGEILKQKIFGFVFLKEEPLPDAFDRSPL